MGAGNMPPAPFFMPFKISLRFTRLPYHKNIIMIGIITAGTMIAALTFTYLWIWQRDRKNNDFNIYS
jgi:hypothetical protein